MFISDNCDDATSSTAIAKRTEPRESPCWMPVAAMIGWPDAREVELLASWASLAMVGARSEHCLEMI